MWDLLTAIVDALAFAPFGLTLLLVGGFAGWTLYGPAGAAAGAAIGLVLGLWLDLGRSAAAKSMRVPVALSAAAVLLYAFLR